ncbi:hypothetical protein GCM10009754_83910 [Amycolatopsis minnesotensis]|uniref:Uncharacterized protein n=1 Tax=Amycolatopsis minnesotensis TaxID=337894 RepID=A0ABP5E7E8_9PSEU
MRGQGDHGLTGHVDERRERRELLAATQRGQRVSRVGRDRAGRSGGAPLADKNYVDLVRPSG